ncbi:MULTISPECIES: hypothetical protein [Roseovarius]|uniref:hypothetical protein n=1 Tax=Roseovarius TaxID=74030 RepID=UPI001C979A26|nr:hypothetical protein [Roseovarius atlanticus]MBY5986410.1 hypothetical protein [Roseovarius atlanticus]MBY6125050.1 hypothetical protein [Roseovarius atlanticus]MBY6150489.1 hypothetical protein [Roseovarius atlanticus]
MPLSILLPMVVLGIAGIAVLLHLLGLSQPATFDNEAAAGRAWLREFPEDTPTRITLSHDRHAALVETLQGRGVVWPMGADTTARYLDGAEITQTGTGLRIALPDYTAPRITLTLDPEEARHWPGLMEARR